MKNQLYIIEFRFTIKDERIKAYNFMVYGDIDYAIKKGNKLLFFPQIDDSRSLWEEMKLKQEFRLPKNIALLCDVCTSINLIERGQVDKDSTILNCINTFSDLLNTINFSFPVRYKKSLFAFANHLTFSKSINSFFLKENYNRDFIKKGLLHVEEIVIKNSLLYLKKEDNKFYNFLNF